MNKKLTFLLSILLATGNGQAERLVELRSPDGATTATLNLDNGHLTASVAHDGTTVVPQIALGLETTAGTLSSGLTLRECSAVTTVQETYTARHGKRKECTNQANRVTVTLNAPGERQLGVELRCYPDGVCFRYLLPEPSDSVAFTEEATAYQLPQGAERWMQRYVTSYEGDFVHMEGEGEQGEWGYPALLHADNCWALLTEADMGRNYCASHLQNTEEAGTYRVTYPHADEGNGKGDRLPRAATPWQSPWRVIIVGGLADLVESTLVEDVCPPCRLNDTSWVEPGTAAWVYWAYNHGTKDYALCKEYVDLAAAMGWKYVLLDWEWDQMGNGGTMEDAAAYAKAKGVKPLIWYNSGGDHNRVDSTPRDRFITHEGRMREFEWLKSLGFAGVKVDFFESDKQMMMNYYLDILEDAAEAGMMVNLHGCTVPRGWSRTYPHLMSMEAVYGAEQYNNSAFMTEAAPRLNCIYPFTRNVVGPMDYTPVAFTNSQHPHVTSYAHELALAVVFESGIQHWADRPEGFFSLPDEARAFMSQVPADWDETRFLRGWPGERVVMARRKGSSWFVGGINGSSRPESLVVDLSFLSPGLHRLTLLADGDSSSELAISSGSVVASDSLSVSWLPHGGFAAVISPAE